MSELEMLKFEVPPLPKKKKNQEGKSPLRDLKLRKALKRLPPVEQSFGRTKKIQILKGNGLPTVMPSMKTAIAHTPTTNKLRASTSDILRRQGRGF